jgi:hypothetical protein
VKRGIHALLVAVAAGACNVAQAHALWVESSRSASSVYFGEYGYAASPAAGAPVLTLDVLPVEGKFDKIAVYFKGQRCGTVRR